MRRKLNAIGAAMLGYDGILHWQADYQRGWRIGYGVSNFLVMEGAPWLMPLGKSIYDAWTKHVQ